MKKTIVLDAAQRRGYRYSELTVISEERKRPQILLSSCFPDSFVLRQFVAGGTYVQWGEVPRKDVVLTKGEPRKILYANRIRSFAACCGTHLFFEDSKDSDTIDFTIASLDDPTPFAPQKAIFLEDKLPWVVIDHSIPSFQTIPEKKS